MTYRQYDLCAGCIHTTCWLEDDPRIHLGSRLTLKGDEMVWRVARISEMRLPEPPRKDWRVGGL